jgi:sterol desaturase/sphingolipid hydroxylase (fatty acid hydroxylase superfamily)
MIGIPVALLTANATEWVMHKYVLHGLGKNRDSMWSFHWHEHHRESRRHGMVDPHYEKPLLGWHGQAKEALALVLAGVAYAPLFPVAPFFTATMLYCGVNYYRKHKRSHQDPKWAREHLPWHYDHHMGPNQHANWCVTRPWFDVLLGTREPYIGTEREAADLAKSAKRARTAQPSAQPPRQSAPPGRDPHLRTDPS